MAVVKKSLPTERAIKTTFVYPPIPDRRWDWSAIRDGYEPGEPVGQGPTMQAAIDDLLDQESDNAREPTP